MKSFIDRTALELVLLDNTVKNPYLLIDKFLLLIKSVIASKAELDVNEAGQLERRTAGCGGDEENLQLQAPFVTT